LQKSNREILMSDIRARVRVSADHRITGIAPTAVPPGEHEVTISVTAFTTPTTGKHFDINNLPTLDLGPWPDGISLRREDIYDDDGR
jgi:hypothetical protein